MIITNPTGFYLPELPTPGVGGNVVFTVSAGPPARLPLLFGRLPTGVGVRQHDPRTNTPPQRRAVLAKLAYTEAVGGQSATTTGTKHYEPGQILDFDGVATAPALDQMLVAAATTRRHDTNLLNYAALGIDAGTASALSDSTAAARDILVTQLNNAVRLRADLESELTDNQAVLNELAKAIAGLRAALLVVRDPTLTAVLDALLAKQAATVTRQNVVTDMANAAAVVAGARRDDLESVSQLVR